MLGSQRKWADYSKSSTVSYRTHLGLLLAWCKWKWVTFSHCVLVKLKKAPKKNTWTRNAMETVLLSAFVSSPVLSSPKFAQLFQSELNYIKRRQNRFNSWPNSSHCSHDLCLLKIVIQYRLKVWTHPDAAKPRLCRVLPPRVHRGWKFVTPR